MATTVNPYLNFNGQASEALAFYQELLNGEVEGLMRWSDMPGQEVPPELANNVMHSCLKVGEGKIMLSDMPPHMSATRGSNNHVMLNLDAPAEVDRIFAGLAEGGEVKMAVDNTFWGARFGEVVDRFGVSWMLHADLPKA